MTSYFTLRIKQQDVTQSYFFEGAISSLYVTGYCELFGRVQPPK